MRVYYLTAFEGHDQDSLGLFKSQVVDFVAALSKFLNDNAEIIAVINEKYRASNYINDLAKRKNVLASTIVVKCFLELFFSKKFIKEILGHIKMDEGVPVIICREIIAALIGIKIKKQSEVKIKVILDKRGLPSEESLYLYDKPLLYRYIRKIILYFIEKYVVKNVSGIRTISTRLKDYIINKYNLKEGEKFIVLPTGVDPNYLIKINSIENKKENNTVVYAGSIYSYQQIERVLKFMNSIGEIYKCYFISYFNDNEIIKLRKKYSNIRFLNNLDHERIQEFLENVEYGICFRSSSIINYVSSPTKIAEYVTKGLMVIYEGDIGIIADMKEMGLGSLFLTPDELLNGKEINKKLLIDSFDKACAIFSYDNQATSIINYLNKIIKG